MRSRRSGLAEGWQNPRSKYKYSFIPAHNDTLRVFDPDGNRVSIEETPFDIRSEINISMAYAGIRFYELPRWKRWRIRIAAWWDRKWRAI